jgi:hypothetical protein
MAATLRCVSVVGLLVSSAACSDSPLPSAPTVVSPAPLQTYELPPPLTGPSTAYVFSYKHIL